MKKKIAFNKDKITFRNIKNNYPDDDKVVKLEEEKVEMLCKSFKSCRNLLIVPLRN